jgi:hypothetical protein
VDEGTFPLKQGLKNVDKDGTVPAPSKASSTTTTAPA